MGGVWFGACVGGGDKCMCILPGLVLLDFDIGGGLGSDDEEFVGVVLCHSGSRGAPRHVYQEAEQLGCWGAGGTHAPTHAGPRFNPT